MKDFANRLWGASVAIYFAICFKPYPLWIKILSCLVVIYWFWNGTSRFEDTKYRKLL